jgi:hypothetical protein
MADLAGDMADMRREALPERGDAGAAVLIGEKPGDEDKARRLKGDPRA